MPARPPSPPRHRKPDLPVKPCQACGRPMSWRKRWARTWDEVKYCSDACRGRRGAVQAAAAHAGDPTDRADRASPAAPANPPRGARRG